VGAAARETKAEKKEEAEEGKEEEGCEEEGWEEEGKVEVGKEGEGWGVACRSVVFPYLPSVLDVSRCSLNTPT
jgi:hypothetical protein